MTDGPFRDNNLDLLRAENSQLKKEIELVKQEKTSLPEIIRENRDYALAAIIIITAAITQQWTLIWLLVFVLWD